MFLSLLAGCLSWVVKVPVREATAPKVHFGLEVHPQGIFLLVCSHPLVSLSHPLPLPPSFPSLFKISFSSPSSALPPLFAFIQSLPFSLSYLLALPLSSSPASPKHTFYPLYFRISWHDINSLLIYVNLNFKAI